MPTYEYRCRDCDHQFDIQQSFSDDALEVCPSCGQASLKKVYGNVGISFKGSGFYKNDARSGTKTSSGTKSSTSDTSTTSSSSDSSGGDSSSTSSSKESTTSGAGTKSSGSSTTSTSST